MPVTHPYPSRVTSPFGAPPAAVPADVPAAGVPTPTLAVRADSATDLVSLWRLPTFWRWHIGAWLALAVGTWLQRGGGAADPGSLLSLVGYTRWALTGAAVSAALAPAVVRLSDRRRWPVAIAARGLSLAFIGAAPWFALHWWLSELGPLAAARAPFVARGLATHVWLLLAWGTAVVGVEALRRADARARSALAAERLAVEARHRLLVSQVNPHFLFNTLNSVRALAAEDPARTRAMVTRLAQFLRAALDTDPLAPTTLGRELDAVAAYLAIEQVRFGERLRPTVDATPEARAATLPGFLLHPLVENAITHGRGMPLTITVRAWCADGRMTIDVENSGTLALGQSPRRGIGLANVRERLTLLYGAAASLALAQDGPTVRARLTLPLAAPLQDVPRGGSQWDAAL